MGFAMSPLTVIMIRALPRSKQGVASAINSTARELGGALGVAILGSLSAPVYAAGVRPAVALLPGDAGKAVGDSLAGAGAVAGYLPGPQAEALLALARSSFVDGMGRGGPGRGAGRHRRSNRGPGLPSRPKSRRDAQAPARPEARVAASSLPEAA